MTAAQEHRLAVFRTDATPTTGGGHVMRCLSLALGLENKGWRIAFAGKSELVCDLTALAGIRPEFLRLEKHDEASTLASHFPSGCALFVIDHYELDLEFERACRPWADRILVVSDQPGQPHDCDLLLDPTFGRTPCEYAPFLPTDCGVLAGPRYAPIRPEFTGLQSRKPCQEIKRVLVAMGATDPDNVTDRILSELAALELKIDVVLTSGAPHLTDVLSRDVGKLHVDVDGESLASLMQAADLCIGAGGSSAWERCAAGLPSLMFVIADNQIEVARGLEAAGAAQALGRPEDVPHGGIADAVQALDSEELDAMAVAAKRLCDGHGAMRVASLGSGRELPDGQAMRLRPIAPADCNIVYQWQIHPDVRRYAHQPTAPSKSEHDAWFAAQLADPEAQYFIVEYANRPAGVLRLEPYAAKNSGWLVSILVALDSQGRGLGRAALDLAHALWPDSTFVAEVLSDNTPSHRLFSGAGYTHDGDRYLRSASADTS